MPKFQNFLVFSAKYLLIIFNLSFIHSKEMGSEYDPMGIVNNKKISPKTYFDDAHFQLEVLYNKNQQ